MLLIVVMLTALGAVAQDVQVSNLKVAADNTITFDLLRNSSGGSDAVWVFIDYFNMDKQQMWRMPVASAELTYTSWAGAKVRTITENNAGFYIDGIGQEAGTVSVSVAPAGDYPRGVIRPCVYVTDHQPVVTYNIGAGGAITAQPAGTAPYSGQYSGGAAWTSPTGAAVNVPAGQHISSFADATGNGGTVLCGTAGSSVTIHPSSAAYQNQVVCKNDAITGTSYTLGGSAGSCTVANLGGLTASLNTATKVLTISGTPTATTTYKITTIGHTAPCEAATISGIITVNPTPATPSLATTGNQCAGTGVTFNATGGTGYEWTGAFNGQTGNSKTSSTATGNYTTSVRNVVTANSKTCYSAYTGNVTGSVNPVSVGGTVSGSKTISAGGSAGTLSLSGHTGAVQRWQSSTNGTSWTNITNTATNLSPGSLSTTTYYRAVVKSGVCAEAFATSATVTVDATSVGGTVAGSKTICAGDTPEDE